MAAWKIWTSCIPNRPPAKRISDDKDRRERADQYEEQLASIKFVYTQWEPYLRGEHASDKNARVKVEFRVSTGRNASSYTGFE